MDVHPASTCARVSAAIVVAIAALMVGCTSSAAPTSQHPPTARSFLRECSTAVYGSLGRFARWSRSSIIMGPIGFVWIRQAGPVPRSRFSRPQAVKVLALVKQGRSAVVTVPRSERRHVSLLFDPTGFTGGPYRVSDGESSVAFRPCPGESDSWREATQFNGGIIVAGARCVTLDVRPQGSPPRRLRSPFGRGTCRSGGAAGRAASPGRSGVATRHRPSV